MYATEEERVAARSISEQKFKTAHPGYHARKQKEYKERFPERTLASQAHWRERNIEEYKEMSREWRGRNKPKLAAKSASRRATELRAIPAWANKKAILSIYEDCPDGMQIDHIVPLLSKTVCGLHCEGNLQYLPQIENQKKNNKIWPSMWGKDDNKK